MDRKIVVVTGLTTSCLLLFFLFMLREKKKREQQQKRLERELSELRRDVSHALFLFQSVHSTPKRELRSSDDEDAFFDAGEEPSANDQQEKDASTSGGFLEKIDRLLLSTDDAAFASAYGMLKDALMKEPNNGEYLRRLAAAAFLFSQEFVDSDPDRRRDLVYEAKDAAFEAKKYLPNDYNVHKWCALTLGVLSDYVSITEKIQNGHTFKEHIDIALKLCPTDKLLHHLLGRWAYEVANLSWIERRAASALFAAPPTATNEEALESLLAADRLSAEPWKENKLAIAKCHYALGNPELARQWLRAAAEAPCRTADDRLAQSELEGLRQKWG